MGRLEGWIGAKSIFSLFQFYGLTHSKFTRCATRWISFKWQARSKQVNNKIQVREQNNRRVETGDTRMYSRSSLFWREVHLRWRGVAPQSPPMPQRLTLFSSKQAMEASSVPLSGGLEGDDWNPYMEVGAQLHNSIGGSQQEPQSFYTEEASRWPLLLKESSTEDGWGKIKSLG
jgi:hypothetical protein